MMAELPTRSLEDAELVRRAQRGEPGAFDALFDRHYSKVYNFALKMEGDRANAEDIVQTAFVRAYEALHRIRDGQAFLAFVYRTVVNLIRDRARSAKRKPWIRFMDLWRPPDGESGGSEPNVFADASLDPERVVARTERDRAMTAAIGELPVDFREVLILHHLQQLDIRQISKVLGVAEGTVKSRLGRARQRLRTTLSDWIEGGEAQ